MRRVSLVRDAQYGLLRGLFRGEGEGEERGVAADATARLRAVTLAAGSRAIGRTLEELRLEELEVEVRAVRRRGARARLAPAQAGALQENDAVLLLGTKEALSLAEERLLKG
jgi:monovalent cation:H+ antiporter-2, CPA2 family